MSTPAALTLTEQLAAQVAERIRAGLLAPGARLPSVRVAALQHGLSAHTVVAAYDRLQAQGLIEARPQRGFFVSTRRTPNGTRQARAPDAATVPVDATTLLRSMLQRPARRHSPGLGTIPPEWLDAALLAGALRRACQGEGFESLTLRYGDPAGDAPLRDALASSVREFGVPADATDIITTLGATHALDLVTRALLRAGDAVLVDEPGWAVEFARLGQLGLRVLPVPRGPDGPDLERFEYLLRHERPKAYITVPVLHNPTGASLRATVVHQILRLADTHDLTIVEDDTYAWLASPHLPRYAALDGLRRTVYLSGFSKILAPGWRVGFICAAPTLRERILDVKMLTQLASPALFERALALCLQQGQLRRHAMRLSAQLAQARARTVRLAEGAGARFVAEPQGLFGWVDLGCDSEALAARLLDEGWLLTPGSLFYARRRPSTLMRINFATSQDVVFWQQLRVAQRAG